MLLDLNIDLSLHNKTYQLNMHILISTNLSNNWLSVLYIFKKECMHILQLQTINMAAVLMAF